HYLEEWDLGEVLDDRTIRYKGRTIAIDRYPIGIDVEGFREMSRHAPDDVRIDSARRQQLGRKQIIGVDRLDYSKGLPDRFQAFGKLLAQHPELEKQVTFLQVAPPTREDVNAYSDIRDELEGLTGSINGRF